jgi:glycosyltransferase involved in cell wall biosynthesis
MATALFLVDNVPFELDSRVRREARTLRSAGWQIVVICMGDAGQPLHEQLEGVHVYRYRKPALGGGFAGHVAEYASTLLAQLPLSLLVLLRHGFSVVHLANPPDLLWVVAAPYRVFGKRVIFDQHDLTPELFEVRFGRRFRALTGLVAWSERMSYRLADRVLAQNETCRRIAIERGRLPPEDVKVVRNGPDLAIDYPRVEPDPEIRALAPVIVGYLGLMNDQDNVDVFLEMARIIRHERERDDIGFVMVGSGDAWTRLRALRDELGLAQAVRMTGRIPWEQVLRTFAATDVCVQPDLPTSMNVKLTMNKLMEYMAFSCAVVAFEMAETHASGGDTVVYVTPYTAEELANAVIDLADDPERRAQLGRLARRRIEETLCWERQEASLLDVYGDLISGATA